MAIATTADPGNGTLARIDPKTVAAPPHLRALLSAQMPDLEKMYAPAMRTAAARLARAVVTEVSKQPKLAKCSALSLISCAVQAAQLQLEIGGPTGQSYMVPYWNKELNVFEAAYQLGYRGMLTLAIRSRAVTAPTVQLVRQGDLFKARYGTTMKIEHEWGEKRGDYTHAYAKITYRAGGDDFEVMTIPEIDDHRRRYSKQGTAKNGERDGIWLTSFDAMALKTPLRKLLKRCPIGVDPGLMDEPEVAEMPALAERSTPRQLPQAVEPDLEALMAAKGMTPGEACGWLNEQFGVANGYDELPAVGDLRPGHREALTEFLSELPDAQPAGAA